MNNFDFFFLFYNNKPLFWFSFFICVCLLYFLYKPYIISLIDPLLFSAINTLFGASVVLFMYFTNSIKPFYLASYFLTQFAFLLGIYMLKPFNPIKYNYETVELKLPNDEVVMKIFYVVSSVITILLQLQVYVFAGIPVLMASRLETFEGGSGFGIVSRFIEVSQIFSNTLLFYFLFNKTTNNNKYLKLYNYLFTIILIIFSILNGSKGAILVVFFCAFSAWIFSFNSTINASVIIFLKKYKFYIFIFMVIIALIVVLIQTDSSLNLNPIEILGTRFIFSGDVYWYAYPNDVIINFNNYNGIKALLTDIYGLFRIESWDKLKGHFGVDLFAYHHVSTGSTGPNARHNVFGLLYFGFWGSIIFSFILGLIFSVMRNLLPILLPRNFITMCVLSYLFIKVVPFLDTDPILSFGYFDNLIIVTPVILAIVYLLYKLFFKIPAIQTK